LSLFLFQTGRYVGEYAEDGVTDLIRQLRLVSALENLASFWIEFLQNKNASFLRETLPNIFQANKKNSKSLLLAKRRPTPSMHT